MSTYLLNNFQQKTSLLPMLKKLLLGLLVIALVAGGLVYSKYQEIFSPNVHETLVDPFVIVPTGTSFEGLIDILNNQNILKDEASFRWVAKKMSFIKPKMRAGRFKIKPEWSNRALIGHLRGGKQATVKVVLNYERLPEDVAGKVSKVIEADSISILNLLRDKQYLSEKGLTPEMAMSVFIPNTYDFFWNKDAKGFFERMMKEHDKFWKAKGRNKKAEAIEMTPQEVYTLASIIQRETNQLDEKPVIAGLYLNRLEKGMALQADPTVVFALKQFDLKRVLYKHLEIDSPYNTYKYAGLPPGPISMAEISTIDAILNADDHDYIFFCAKGDGSGYHSFAKSLSGHNANKNIYKRNLKARGKR